MQIEDLGYQPQLVTSLQAARQALEQTCPGLILLDQQLPDGAGLDLLEEMADRPCMPPVILITGMRDTDLAILAMKAGAYDFIRKPMDVDALNRTIETVLRSQRAMRPVGVKEVQPAGMIGNSPAITAVAKTIGRVAQTNATVLITGESGTGKEVAARAIHKHSGRKGAFVAINCSAIVETLLESELFGHEKGSFTGASTRKLGKFETARDGTLFLDEIGELAPRLQAKLLRVLQEQNFTRVGGNELIQTNARILAATNQDLEAMVREKTFREDLYFRLNVIHLHLPPLRARREDLPELVDHLLARVQAQVHKRITHITKEAWAKLREYPWPGNIRELENVLLRAVILAPGPVLTQELFQLDPPAQPSDEAEVPELISLEELERRQVKAILEYTRWNKGRACEILGIARPTLDRKIAKFGLN